MPTNMDRYKADLADLIARGEQLEIAFGFDCEPKLYTQTWEEKFTRNIGAKESALEPAAIKKRAKEMTSERISKLPDFKKTYQGWYSEAKSLVKQILPLRLADFARHYEKPNRKELTNENYVIEDYLQGLQASRGDQVVVAPSAAMSRFTQQLAIVRAASERFESSLFDIRQLVQADLLDSELDAAGELASRGFYRAAGAVAGVVLEHHLAQVCQNHAIAITKKDTTISVFNDALKAADVIDVPTWRFIQHLGDIRNLCDHNKLKEPTGEQVSDLIEGVAKTSKTLF
jgi:hypothetical protein